MRERYKTLNFAAKQIDEMDIINMYYKRVFDDYTVLVQVNPESLRGMELIIHPDGKVEKTKMEFDEDIYEDLKVDEFKESSPLEFNLYLKM